MIKINRFGELNEGYNGKGLNSSRADIINELVDVFVDSKILDFEISDVIQEAKTQVLYLVLSKKESTGNYIKGGFDLPQDDERNIVLRLDLSECDIELGTWDYGSEEYVPKIDLNTDSIKQRKTAGKFGI